MLAFILVLLLFSSREMRGNIAAIMQDPDNINDDYCDDTEKGSDETTTSACSFLHTKFECKTKEERDGIYSKRKIIPTSRINDGVCDCCDGSDEVLNILGDCMPMVACDRKTLGTQTFILNPMKRMNVTTATQSKNKRISNNKQGLRGKDSLKRTSTLISAKVMPRRNVITSTNASATSSFFSENFSEIFRFLLAGFVLSLLASKNVQFLVWRLKNKLFPNSKIHRSK